MVVEIYTPSVERLKVSLKTQGRTADLSKTRQNLFCCGTARHGHGKTTPVFDRGETASLFGIVIPL